MADQDLGQNIIAVDRRVSQLSKALIRTRQRVYAVEQENKMLRRGVEPRMPIEFTSQYGEDLLAWDLLGGPSSGFFMREMDEVLGNREMADAPRIGHSRPRSTPGEPRLG